MTPHILALDVAGAPHRWINIRDAARNGPAVDDSRELGRRVETCSVHQLHWPVAQLAEHSAVNGEGARSKRAWPATFMAAETEDHRDDDDQ
jgi:hypothetical protein